MEIPDWFLVTPKKQPFLPGISGPARVNSLWDYLFPD